MINKPLPFLNHDPQDDGPQYLEDLATGYWFSEALFTAVEMEIFTLLEPEGKTAGEIAGALEADAGGVKRFLHTLSLMGLVSCNSEKYFNTKMSGCYLVKGTDLYQGDSVLWRKYLADGWRNLAECIRTGGRVDYSPTEEDPGQLAGRIRRYINAMDRVARTKVLEMLPFFEGFHLKGEILDAGTGSGAVAAGFLEHFPSIRATLADLPEVLEYTRELMLARGHEERVAYCPVNLLESWPFGRKLFDLVVLSNIVHAYAGDEISGILKQAAKFLKPDGIMIIHDFFFEHVPSKAGLFDLNMFINTYNGKVFSQEWVCEQLTSLNLYSTGMVPLKTDTAVIFASKNEHSLANLCLDAKTHLAVRIREIGFNRVCRIGAGDIHVPDWTEMKCRFGCSGYGKRHCPPRCQSPAKTREIIKDYRYALLLEGEPPTGAFQQQVLVAEKEAFKAGFHKAFAYWAGPCSICGDCSACGPYPGDGVCRNPGKPRPSMEGAGIDVFETVRRAGIDLKTLKNQDEFVKYFALLLLE